MWRQLGPFRLAGSPLMKVIASTPVMGPLVAASDIGQTLRALDEVLDRQKISHVEVAFASRLDDESIIPPFGYSAEVCQAVSLPLAGRSLDELWRSMSSACRRAIRKAEYYGVEISEANDFNWLNEYYRMCEEVYRGTGRRPHLSKEFYAAAWEQLAKQGNLRVLLANYHGRIIAGGVFLIYRDWAYYLSGAAYDQSLTLRPNNLVQWHFIQWAAEQGCARYDLGGAVVPGITRFKLSFGSEIYTYTRLYCARSAFARWGRRTYKAVIPLWRMLTASL
jgi:lipid II:glycine glycyltransferase (peptidoglycan interpeptide bridge formation enzyme)